MTTKKFPLDELVLDERCQARADVDHDAVQEYRAAYEAGVELPPLTVFLVSGVPYVIDGFHRLPAAMSAGKRWAKCLIAGEGTIDEAIWRATAANQAHGVRRTNADKRKAVRLALETEIGMEQSNRVIAEHVGVSHEFVNKIRNEIESERRRQLSTDDSGGDQLSTDDSRTEATRVGKDGRRRPAKMPRQLSTDRTSEPPAEPEPAESESPAPEPVEAPQVTETVSPLPAYGQALEFAAAIVRRARLDASKHLVTAPHHLVQRVEGLLREAEQAMKLEVPEVCPGCSGPGCKWCKGHGWLSRAEASSVRATARRNGKELVA